MNTARPKKRLNFTLIGLAIAFAGLVLVLIVFLINRIKEKNKLAPIVPKGQIDEVGSVPDEAEQKVIFNEIYNAALKEGFNEQAALAIAGQSAHETGRWSSELALKYWNVFGMKDGGGGANIQNGAVKGFATYPAWESSLMDYAEWCRKKSYPFAENLNTEQHLQWLKSKGYFTDSLANYKKSVLSLINELTA
jgi:hypothetical protein